MRRKTQGGGGLSGGLGGDEGGKLSGGLGGDGGGLFPVSSFSLVSFGSLPAGTATRRLVQTRVWLKLVCNYRLNSLQSERAGNRLMQVCS